MGTGKGIYLICCENAFGRGYCTADPSLRFGKGFRRLEGDLAYQSDMRSKLCAHRETDTHTHTISKDIQRLVLGAELPEPWLDKSAPEESPARVLSSIHSLTQSLCWHTGGLYHKPHSPSRRQRAPSLFICARLSPGMQYSARSTCARKRGRKRSDTGYRRLQRAQVKSQCQCRQLLWWCRPPPPLQSSGTHCKPRNRDTRSIGEPRAGHSQSERPGGILALLKKTKNLEGPVTNERRSWTAGSACPALPA